MVNLDRLKDEIDASGMTMVSVANRAGMLRETLYNRLNGKSEFRASEIQGLTNALRLSKQKRDEIFFN